MNPTNSKNYVPPKGFLTSAQAAEILGIPLSKFHALRYGGGGPEGRKVGSRVIFSEDELKAWADFRQQNMPSVRIPFQQPKKAKKTANKNPFVPVDAQMDMLNFMNKFAGKKKLTTKACNYAQRREVREIVAILPEFSKNELFQILEAAMVAFAGRKDWHPNGGELVQFSHVGRLVMGCVQKLNKKTATVLAHTNEGKKLLRVDYADLTPAPEEYVCQIQKIA